MIKKTNKNKAGPKQRIADGVIISLWVSKETKEYLYKLHREAKKNSDERLTIGKYFEKEFIEPHREKGK